MESSGKLRWVLKPEGYPPEWAALRHDWGVPDPILGALWNRGLRTIEEVGRFLRPQIENLHDPFLLCDADRAVARVQVALRAHERFFVFGDYDVDGITAASLWTRVLSHLGGDVQSMVPNRMEDGYGLSLRAVERAYAAGCKVLIANDCGTTAHEAIARAQDLGLDVVVCDHHMPESSLPPAHALVNPRRADDSYPFPELAAVGVAFKILQGLIQRHYGEPERRYLMNQLDLVTLGTIADVVPLVDENRVFVHFGIRVLRVRRRPAFQALIERAGLEDRFLESSHIAFSLIPRINAAGRLGVPETALLLLLEEDLETSRRLAARLEEDNTERRGLNELVQEQAARSLEGRVASSGEAIVLGSTEWHPGVLGIAASRLVHRYRVPVFLVSLQGPLARGSARSPRGTNLLALLERAAPWLLTFGGHKCAAGFSIDPLQFPPFQDALLKANREEGALVTEETLGLDGALDPGRCDVALARWVERMGPFGEGNEEPIYSGRGLCRSVRVLRDKHLKMEVVSGGARVDCIGFGLGELAAEIPAGGASFQLAFTPTLNRFRGQERLQLKLREIEFV